MHFIWVITSTQIVKHHKKRKKGIALWNRCWGINLKKKKKVLKATVILVLRLENNIHQLIKILFDHFMTSYSTGLMVINLDKIKATIMVHETNITTNM